ncbi:MarR family winged helix-turn-helix transcriptional regulator [Cohaesibacter intestini]|uniref:MarR family winged helix-turn-helix transcriptional regulator n=1 Tax=Cohaesibacter intestini TaxID=2211145 RepID=UPI000DE891FB|nr:MarR family transcriptional regulator [Cohaesibacter intestini]
MTEELGRLDKSLMAFMRYVPSHVAPILYRATYNDRQLLESELMALMTLTHRGPLSPTSISRLLNMQKGSLTSVLKRLEKLGLIARRAHPADDRSHVVELSSEGVALAHRLKQRMERDLKALFETMALADRQAAATGLDLMAQHFRKLEEEKMAQARTAYAKSLNWYHAASPEDRKEYDAFGPWLTEVKSEADMPRRFRSLYSEYRDATYLIKVPRNADRRNLRPGMDLYEAVIAVDEAGVSLARLEETSIWTLKATWDDIAAICSFGDRLQGIWTLYLKDGNRPSISFNRVSSDLIEVVTDFVRSHLTDKAKASNTDTDEFEFSDEDLFFGSTLLELRRREGGPFTPLHFEPQGQPCLDAQGNEAISTGVLMLDGGGELVIINRGDPCHPSGEAWFAGNDLFIPYNRITSCTVVGTPAPGSGQFYTLVIQLDQQTIEQPCLEDPKTVVATIWSRSLPKS